MMGSPLDDRGRYQRPRSVAKDPTNSSRTPSASEVVHPLSEGQVKDSPIENRFITFRNPMQRKQLLIIACFLLSSLSVIGQSQRTELDSFNQKRTRISRTGMAVLGGWGAANFVGSGTAYFLSNGEARYFHQMNALWNIVNLSLAIPGYLGAQGPEEDMGAIATLKAQSGHERIFLFNAGLDVGYVMGGMYLRELSRRKPDNAARLRGYGNSFILQGGFLLLFDAVMYGFHKHHNNNELEPILENVELGATGMRITIPLAGNPKSQIPKSKAQVQNNF